VPGRASNNDVLCLALASSALFFLSMPESRATKPDGRYFFPLQELLPPLPISEKKRMVSIRGAAKRKNTV